jgi:hypothetical protein
VLALHEPADRHRLHVLTTRGAQAAIDGHRIRREAAQRQLCVVHLDHDVDAVGRRRAREARGLAVVAHHTHGDRQLALGVAELEEVHAARDAARIDGLGQLEEEVRRHAEAVELVHLTLGLPLERRVPLRFLERDEPGVGIEQEIEGQGDALRVAVHRELGIFRHGEGPERGDLLTRDLALRRPRGVLEELEERRDLEAQRLEACAVVEALLPRRARERAVVAHRVEALRAPQKVEDRVGPDTVTVRVAHAAIASTHHHEVAVPTLPSRARRKDRDAAILFVEPQRDVLHALGASREVVPHLHVRLVERALVDGVAEAHRDGQRRRPAVARVEPRAEVALCRAQLIVEREIEVSRLVVAQRVVGHRDLAARRIVDGVRRHALPRVERQTARGHEESQEGEGGAAHRRGGSGERRHASIARPSPRSDPSAGWMRTQVKTARAPLADTRRDASRGFPQQLRPLVEAWRRRVISLRTKPFLCH